MSPIDETQTDPEQLREEVLRLRATVQSQSEVLKARDEALKARDEALKAQEEALRSAREQTELYKREYEKLARQAFGRRSERLDGQDEAQLLLLTAVELADATPKAAQSSPAAKAAKRSRRGGGGRNKLPPHIQRIEVTSSDDGPTACACCGGELAEIGEDRSERLERLPAQFKVLVVVRKKRACPKCPSEGVLTQPAPPFGLQRSKYADGFVAQVLVDNFGDELAARRAARHTGGLNARKFVKRLIRLLLSMLLKRLNSRALVV